MIKYSLFLIKNKLFILIIMFLGQTIIQVQASTIFSHDVNFRGRDQDQQIRVTLGIGEGFTPPGLEGFIIPPIKVVIFDFSLTSDDVGNTFTVSSGREFDEAVVFLTNGIDDRVRIDVARVGSFRSAGVTTEADFFSGKFFRDSSGVGINGIDFSGHDIDNISLTVNELIFGPDFNDDGISAYTFNTTIRVSSVPLPTTVWFFCSGLLGLISITRKRNY